MRNFIFPLFFCLATTFCFGQSVSINTDGTLPSASAMLDVKSTTKGLLIPRMTLAQRNAIASPATGLLVFQSDIVPGFYYYTGSGWINLALASATWSTSGNSGVNASNNFIGTTDNNPINFRVNNVNAGQLDPSGNIFFGINAGQSNTAGSDNIAIGEGALHENTSTNFNLAIGTNALY